MNKVQAIQKALSDMFVVSERNDGVEVTTQCVYPSNAFARVIVHGGVDTFVVSDEGGALREIESAGGIVVKPDKVLSPIVQRFGLQIANGTISAPPCGFANLGLAIALVANASKSSAEWLFEHTKIRPTENFKFEIAKLLRRDFHQSVRSDTLVGHSNKPHKFDNIIFLSGSRRLVIDPVVNDRSSINARVVANMDLRAAEYEGLEQRIVFDDRQDWKIEDLNLLQVGAPVIKYSRAEEVIKRLASV